MTRQQVIHLFVGFLICFCLFGKQVAQDYDLIVELPTSQHVVAEEASPNDLIDSGDDLLVLPFMFAASLFFWIFPIFTFQRYLQPAIPSPQRPPRFNLFNKQ